MLAIRLARRQASIKPISHRTIFNFLRKQEPSSPSTHRALRPDDDEPSLFHLHSKSPSADIRLRGERIKKFAQCPVCLNVEGTRKNVKHECVDCGWPTHCGQEHWEQDEDHAKYCTRLREVNEDDHDLRSGRTFYEYEMPGPIPYGETVSLSNWDIFWYTRGFLSIDTERARRHLSKLLTYPMTIAGVLHEYSNLTTRNQRVTPEGLRSLNALRTTLHVPMGGPEKYGPSPDHPPVRIFILGSRAESFLPPHVWDQLSLMFPSATLSIYHIGPDVSLPKVSLPSEEEIPGPEAPPATSQGTVEEEQVPTLESSETLALTKAEREELNAMRVWKPKIPELKMARYTRNDVVNYGVPSYTSPVNDQLQIAALRSPYGDVHARFGPFDPYTDVFFAFQPGFGFPSQHTPGIPQIASGSEWGGVIPLILETKCSLFVTGFSPEDIERDIRSLEGVPGIAGEFDWILTPGENPFKSERWEVAEFDPRLMVRTNWGIWGIRGKRRDIQETS
ncbi:translational activator for mitochondrial COX1 [Serendipita sp. 396]|nr:translational activator for mitochondrial COX1 [Serendipita sp. 396]KAG8787803.1 translational activator for mitochondrial COX1 [Serendipita sp. 397]KAG8802323.1 translational activator for mitochondrial COX1 [Serendipita sp. 398]KAG8827469.1 translational activator for mitochondrial COX1 [Serendipita sp. 401]KAG8835377.1 translational activator for mitochondrial COX1 [Serendipita sp. 400]KAG8857095.1 translational activator for mitochondrial COX1 [Serendipita sp. 411]KAG8873546.1 translat